MNARHKKSPPSEGFFLSFQGLMQCWGVFVCFYTAAILSRTLFLLYNYPAYKSSGFNGLIHTFLHGWKLDISTAAYITMLMLALTLPWSFSTKNKGIGTKTRYLVGGIFSFLFIWVSLADAELFQKWGNRINQQALQYLSFPREAMAASAAAPWLQITAIGIGLSLILLWMNFRIYRWFSRIKYRPSLHRRLALWFISLICWLYWMRGGMGTVPLNQSSVAFSNDTRLNILAVNPLWNLGYYLSNGTRSIDFKVYQCCTQQQIRDVVNSVYRHDSTYAILNSTGTKPNILIIILESFTAQASKRFGGALNLTPQLDKIAHEGFAFERCYAGGDRTDKGLAAIFSAWQPQPWHSVLHEPEKAARLPSLSAPLNKAGYQTIFAYGGDSRFADMRAYLLNIGLTRIIDKDDFPLSSQNSKWGVTRRSDCSTG
jgi:phosphoglycerol transferase MdoB-like AlkP superfamily enzyme